MFIQNSFMLKMLEVINKQRLVQQNLYICK